MSIAVLIVGGLAAAGLVFFVSTLVLLSLTLAWIAVRSLVLALLRVARAIARRAAALRHAPGLPAALHR